jgi:uncharacterized protein YjbI with pentapeptide repeats
MPQLFVEPIEKSMGDWHLPMGSGLSFFKGLTEGLLGFIKSPADGLKGFLEPFLDANSLKNLNPGQVAYHLIYQSLKYAAYKILKEHKMIIGNRRPGSEAISEELDIALKHIRLTIDSDFFKSTHNLLFWNEIKGLFSKWLIKVFTMSEDTAQELSNSLPLYFEIALDEEWSRYPDGYQILRDKLLTPLTSQAQQAQSWLNYKEYLQNEINKPILGENFGLMKIYISLRGYYERENPEKENNIVDSYFGKETKPQKVVVNLETCLNEWLAKDNPRDALRVISGDPGSGKSSLARVFAARQILHGLRRVWFIPLFRFDADNASLESALQKFAQEKIFDGHSLPFKLLEDRSLLIFDGLDELEPGKKAWGEISSLFIERLQTALLDWNHNRASVKVLITGRTLAIREYHHRFCREFKEAVLYILPYHLPKKEHSEYYDPEYLLRIPQRDDWWQKYGRACGQNFFGLPAKLREKKLKLDEITSRPILNHLVAQLYRDGKLHLTREININSIYFQMIRATYDRGWGPRYPHDVTKDIHFDQFLHTLEEIAVVAWHGDSNRAHESDIQNRLANSPQLKDILESFQKREGSQAISRLLTGFYFGRSEKSLKSDRIYEFTHKTFGEYLFARSLIRLLSILSNNYTENNSDKQQISDEWSFLDIWIGLCGPAPLNEDSYTFLYNELMLFKDNQKVAHWQGKLTALISFMLANGIYGKRLPDMSFQELCRQARNAELTLLAVLNACAEVIARVSDIRWPSDTSAGTWLSRLIGQRTSSHEFAFAQLSLLDLSGQQLSGRDFISANLRRTNLADAKLMFANLMDAKLISATLNKADFTKSNLSESDLKGADLRGAILLEANLSGAILKETDLRGANLSKSDLRGANLSGSNLSKTDLSWADLSKAILIGVDLTKANLRGSDLNEADLSDSNLKSADLSKATLIKSDLSRSNLSGADLSQAFLNESNLSHSDLSSANFNMASLSGANLSNSKFSEADFSSANLNGADLCGADLQDVVINERNKLYDIKFDNNTKISEGSDLKYRLKRR